MMDLGEESTASSGGALLTRWSREFSDVALERQFRNEAHADSRRHERTGLLLFIFITCMFTLNDVLALWSTREILVLLLVRGTMVAIATSYILLTRKREYSLLSDRLTAALVLLLGALILGIESTRPPDYLGHLGLDVMYVIVVYLIIPLPLGYQCVISLTYTLFELLLLVGLRTEIDSLSLYVASTGLVIANIVGLTFARRMGRYHRERFYALIQEKQARAELEAALAEVKTLSSLLPICCVCKKIRDDSGYWSSVESYLHEHLRQQLTHGLCPDCFADQTRELRAALQEESGA